MICAVKYPDLSRLYSRSDREEEEEEISEEQIEPVIDLLVVLAENGCDDKETVDEAIDKALMLLLDEKEEYAEIACGDKVIRIVKKDGGFEIEEE